MYGYCGRFVVSVLANSEVKEGSDGYFIGDTYYMYVTMGLSDNLLKWE